MKKDQILLVEGNNDFHVVGHICKNNDIDVESFETIDSKTIEKAIKNLKTNIKRDLLTIGIIVDADSDSLKIWNDLQKECSEFEYEFPEVPNHNGTILKNDDYPTLGIWIMPDNKAPGMLEDFVKVLIPENDKLFPIVDETLQSIENQKLNKYKPIHRQKAEIHTWLAWQKEPGTPMGHAISFKYLTTDKELCNTFVAWLKELFVVESKTR